MGIIIDNHFYSELFEEKKVNCYNNVYLLLFDTIWPSVKNFKAFLSSSDPTLKIEYAKKIYENWAFVNNIFLPPFTILNVLEDQFVDFEKKSKKYIPQDHVTHCIHLYILGIYIFFNSPMLNQKMLETQCEQNYYLKIKEFVKKWQIFALYHDVGYFFEDKNIDKKDINIYDNIYYHTLHYLTTKHIARTLTLKALAEKSNLNFNLNCLNSDIITWYDIKKDCKISNKKLKAAIENFSQAICINSITNDEELSLVLPLLNDQEYLIAVYDEYGTCISLIIRKSLNVVNFYTKKTNIKDEILINNIVNFTNQNYIFKYYLQGIKTNDFWMKAINDMLVINEVNFQLPSNLSAYFSMNSDSIRDLFFVIFNWVVQSLPLDCFKEQTLYETNYLEILRCSIIENIAKTLEETVNILKIDNNKDVKNAIKECKNKLSKNSSTLTDEIIEYAGNVYECQYGITHNFIEYYKHIINIIYKNESLKNDIDATKFIKIEDSKIRANPFIHNSKNSFQKNLYNAISNLSKNLNIDITDLLNYHSPYAPFDHGVISAGILYQVSSFISNVKKYCEINSNILSLAWDSSYGSENEFIEFCAECIFSVLLHNVYTKKSGSEYGLDYYQDININPFSYFCTFCDTIQKWGRPKKLDLSKANLPDINYLEDEFDINISNNTIYIKCIKKNISNVKELIQGAETFLPGISKLVKIEQY